MIEQKFIVDRYITLPNFPGKSGVKLEASGGKGGDKPLFDPIETLPSRPFYLHESVKFTGTTSGFFSKKNSQIQAGHGAKAHRNFVWLPYLEGSVTQVHLLQADVLTGPFSGCWCVIYRSKKALTDQVFAAHIGTVETKTDPKTIAVKRTWNSIAESAGFTFIAAFNPFAEATRQMPTRQKGDSGVFSIYSIMTASHELYAVCLWPHETSDQNNRVYRVAAKIKVATKTAKELSDAMHKDLPLN